MTFVLCIFYKCTFRTMCFPQLWQYKISLFCIYIHVLVHFVNRDFCFVCILYGKRASANGIYTISIFNFFLLLFLSSAPPATRHSAHTSLNSSPLVAPPPRRCAPGQLHTLHPHKPALRYVHKDSMQKFGCTVP